MRSVTTRRLFGAIITSALLGSLMIAPPATAAVKVTNGKACTKLNSTTKSGTDTYKCTKNPIVKNAKLTWVWTGCITAAANYTTVQSKLNALTGALAKAKIEQTQQRITDSIKRMLEWKSSKIYATGEFIYTKDTDNYYVALSAVPAGNAPSATNVGAVASTTVFWAVNAPSATDPTKGTAPAAESVAKQKEDDYKGWQTTVTKLTADVVKLKAIKSPDAKTTALINTMNGQISTLGIGIKAAAGNVKNLRDNIRLLTTTQSATTQLNSAKEDLKQAQLIRSQSCAAGL